MQDTKHLPWCLPPGFRRGCGLESQQFGTFSVKEDTVTLFLRLMRGHMNLARPQYCWNYSCFPMERPAFHSACARRWAGMGIIPLGPVHIPSSQTNTLSPERLVKEPKVSYTLPVAEPGPEARRGLLSFVEIKTSRLYFWNSTLLKKKSFLTFLQLTFKNTLEGWVRVGRVSLIWWMTQRRLRGVLKEPRFLCYGGCSNQHVLMPIYCNFLKNPPSAPEVPLFFMIWTKPIPGTIFPPSLCYS